MKCLPTCAAIPLAILLAACAPPPTTTPAPRAVLVRTVTADAGAPTIQTYTGEITARHENDLAFRIGGKLIERTVDIGASVTRGQVLARLDPQDAHLSATAAASRVAAAEADLALAQAELVRTEALLARSFVSASAVDARRTALQAAKARLRQARAEAASAGNQTAYTELIADGEGVITAAAAEAGQVVGAGQTILRLARTGEREVLVHVPESRVLGLTPDTPVEVRLWLAPERSLRGAVREIAPAADRTTRTYAVRIRIDGGKDLPLGATASVAFVGSAAGQSLVPLGAVSQTDGGPAVWLVDGNGRLSAQPVDIAAFREDGAAIRGGLPPGSRIVIAGVHRLVAGETVRAVEEGSMPALDLTR